MKKIILILPAVCFLPACASIIDGHSQDVSINTDPPGAACTLYRDGLPVASVPSTPGGVYIDKTKYNLQITCSKDGYQDTTITDKSGVDGATFGNFGLGGPIGWAIDSASGSDNHYDSPVNMTLSKK